MDQHIDAVYEIVRENLAQGRTELFPEFYEALNRAIDEGAPSSAGPPWLMLPIFVCEALDGSVELAHHVAAAMEIGRISAGCLDEWQDQDTEGALWRTLGGERTVTLANAMLGFSFLALTRLLELGLSVTTVVALVREFGQTLVRMCEGQYVDLGGGLSLEVCELVAGAKSGSLLRLGCRAGAIVAGADEETATRYGEFGHNLGVLVQMWNDFEGLAGRQGKGDAEQDRALPVVATQALAETAYEAQSAEGQAGQLYALVRLQVYHQRAAEALARCPSPGRLGLFLDLYSTRRLAEMATPGDALPEGERAP